MRYLSFLILFFSFLFSGTVFAQLPVATTETTLEKLFGRLVNNYNDSSRVIINDSIKTIIDSYVESDSVFNHRFKTLRHLGQIVSPDSTIKIVTWNLVLTEEKSHYYCYIIKREEGRKNKIYRLYALYSDLPLSKVAVYSASNWYGALYYDLRRCRCDSGDCWVLLGVDFGNPMISRKILDVLSFSEDGSLVLGKKIFKTEDKLLCRDFFEYSSSAVMSLRFNSDSSAVFDHLVPFETTNQQDKKSYGPEYSYDAYSFKDNIWTFTPNVDARNNK